MKSLRIIFYILLVFIIPAISNDWQVDKKADNKVTFYSSTSLLDFEGNTDKIDGYIYWKGDEVFGADNEIYFEVPLATFETGIGKRDSDMREDVLHTNTYPIASFKGNFKKVDKIGSDYQVIVKGEMSLHGIAKEVEIPGKISMSKDNMNVSCSFIILLQDYLIEAPSLVAFIKVAQEIKIELNFNLKEAQ